MFEVQFASMMSEWDAIAGEDVRIDDWEKTLSKFKAEQRDLVSQGDVDFQ